MLTKQLRLTSDQQPKVLEILKSEQSQMENLRSDSSVTQDDRRSKMMEIHKSVQRPDPRASGFQPAREMGCDAEQA